MTEPTTTISVRGEALQVVPPDCAVLRAFVGIDDEDKTAALGRAGSVHAAALGVLRAHGGVALTVDSVDAPLTWSTRAVRAHRAREHDDRKRPLAEFWRVSVPVLITIRDLARLDELWREISAIPELSFGEVNWQVDARNAAWSEVRAAAIMDAIAKARDYAAALGGAISSLEHVADAGLLGGDSNRALQRIRGLGLAGGGEFESSTPDLDPVPQELSATIEARFAATVASL